MAFQKYAQIWSIKLHSFSCIHIWHNHWGIKGLDRQASLAPPSLDQFRRQGSHYSDFKLNQRLLAVFAFHANQNHHYVLFRVQLLVLNVVIMRFHLVLCSLLFNCCVPSLVYIYFTVYLSILLLKNIEVISDFVYCYEHFWREHKQPSLLGLYPCVEFLDHRKCRLAFSFWKVLPSSFPKWLYIPTSIVCV